MRPLVECRVVLGCKTSFLPSWERWLSVSRHPIKPVQPGQARLRFFRSLFQAAVSSAIVLIFSANLFAQTQETNLSPGALKKLSPMELMDVDVTSVSKHPEKLSGAASAVQVITGDDIRRSGVSSLPEALRLAANLDVAQVSSSQWAISSRGFNHTADNKLLVMSDGRS